VRRLALARSLFVSLVVSAISSTGLRAQVNFTFTPIGPVPVQVTSFSTTSGSTGTWNFGDGTTSTTLPDVDHGYASPGIYRADLMIGSNFIDKDVGIIPASDPQDVPVPNFTASTTTPIVGQTVTFTDTSTGAIGHWIWDFGNGQKSYITSKTLAHSPLHGGSPRTSYSAPGTYTVTLEIQNNTTGSAGPTQTLSITVGSSPSPTATPPPTATRTKTPVGPSPTPTRIRTRTPTPTATPPPSTNSSITIPVAAHVVGVGETLFLTDAEIENPNNFPVSATFSFFPAGTGVSPIQMPLNLDAFETRVIRDVAASTFGVTNSFGALRLDTNGSPPAALRMTSRTYDESSLGSLGMAIPGQANLPPSTASVFVTGIQGNADFRTNLGAVNVTNAALAFQVLLRASNGAVAGVSSPMSLAAGQTWQNGIQTIFPGVTGAGLTAEFQSVSGSPVPVAYGTLADNVSEDLTYYPSLQPSLLWYFPVFSRVSGVGGALFKSELSVASVSDGVAAVTLTFFDQAAPNAPRTATLTLNPHETRLTDDALQALFGLSNTFGGLRVESSQPIVVGQRIYSASPTLGGTVGQQADPTRPEGLYSRATILGLRQDSAFRSNVGIFNFEPTGAAVALTLRRPSGAMLAAASLTLGPQSMRQVGLADLFPGVVFPAGELLTLHLDAGATQVVAYAIVADNTSQDLTSSPALSLDGVSLSSTPLWSILLNVLIRVYAGLLQ